MADPIFSIITVTKNCEKTILSTLKSVSLQSLKNYEHLVFDGFSEDNTFDIIKNFESKNIKKKQIFDESCYDAMNQALKSATGKYVLFLHSGDILFSSDTLSEIYKNLRSNDEILIGGCIFYSSNGFVKRIWKINIKKKISVKNCYSIPHTGTIISKKLIDEIGPFNLNYKISSDTDYILRIFSKKNLKYNLLDFFICFMETGGLSTNKRNVLPKIKEDLKIYRSFFGILIFSFIYMKKILFKLPQRFKRKKSYNLNLRSVLYKFK